MKKILLTAIVVLATTALFAQKYITKNGHISFFSETPLEKIEAHNKQVNSAFDITTGDFIFKLLMKSFEFEKALMQEHFNENYVESDTYPNSEFKGKVVDHTKIDFTKNGKHDVMVEGDLTMHGITKKVKEKGTLEIKDGKIMANSNIKVKPADYGINIPKAVVANIAETKDVKINVTLEEFKK